jgi:hypothetical protein
MTHLRRRRLIIPLWWLELLRGRRIVRLLVSILLGRSSKPLIIPVLKEAACENAKELKDCADDQRNAECDPKHQN